MNTLLSSRTRVGLEKKERECIKRGEGLVENKRKIEVAGFRVAIL